MGIATAWHIRQAHMQISTLPEDPADAQIVLDLVIKMHVWGVNQAVETPVQLVVNNVVPLATG
jgi:hypothetical protein